MTTIRTVAREILAKATGVPADKVEEIRELKLLVDALDTSDDMSEYECDLGLLHFSVATAFFGKHRRLAITVAPPELVAKLRDLDDEFRPVELPRLWDFHFHLQDKNLELRGKKLGPDGEVLQETEELPYSDDPERRKKFWDLLSEEFRRMILEACDDDESLAEVAMQQFLKYIFSEDQHQEIDELSVEELAIAVTQIATADLDAFKKFFEAVKFAMAALDNETPEQPT